MKFDNATLILNRRTTASLGNFCLPRYRVVLVSLIVFLLTACSSSNTTPAPPPAAPVFTSTPVTQAVEATPYTYQLAASGTAAVTFSLTGAPTGATLSGNTISWTPTAEQSRVSNNFTVTATASGGPPATQSWVVTPSGTIRISRVDTLWNENGSTNKAFDWSPISSYVAALVPQSDGSFKSFPGTAGANGTFEIPNVPAGYYWLKLGPRDTYWTSSSTFDVGGDIFVTATNPTTATPSTTYINFNFTSLDPMAAPGLLQFDALETLFPAYRNLTNPGSTTFSGGFGIGGNLDFSAIKNAFVRQYEPTAFGSMDGYVMGPSLTLSNLSLTTGGPNTISGALNPTVPTLINLSVKGSAWAPLFDHVAPIAPTATGGGFFLSVQPYISADGPNVSSSKPIDLIWTGGNCTSGNFTSGGFSRFLSPSTNPPLTTDVEAGAVQYSDPFPSSWRRAFRVCQSASVSIPMPGGSTQNFNLLNSQTTSLPTATVKPLVSAVQNAKINGADLFTAGTINGTAVTLSWDPPATGTPFGYTVAIMSPTTSPGGTLPVGASPIGTLPIGTAPGTIIGTVGTFPVGTPPVGTLPVGTPPGTIIGGIGTVGFFSTTLLSTAKTSITVPPNLLSSGKTYLFVITSAVDGRANMETSPRRSSLPTANAQLISAPITIQ